MANPIRQGTNLKENVERTIKAVLNDGCPQRRDRVMGKQHVDILPILTIVIGHGDVGR